jgi:hypothetical protein
MYHPAAVGQRHFGHWHWLFSIIRMAYLWRKLRKAQQREGEGPGSWQCTWNMEKGDRGYLVDLGLGQGQGQG